MSYENPVSVYPELIHGSNYKPDINGIQIVPFILIKTGEKKCNLRLNKQTYENLHLIEFLNACAVLMFDLDFSQQTFCCLNEGGKWFMSLTADQAKNIEKLLNLITDEDFWKKQHSKNSGGQGFR